MIICLFCCIFVCLSALDLKISSIVKYPQLFIHSKKEIMKKAALLFLAFISMSLVSAQNILTDGDFSSTTMVTPYNGGPGPANL